MFIPQTQTGWLNDFVILSLQVVKNKPGYHQTLNYLKQNGNEIYPSAPVVRPVLIGQ